MDSERCLDAPLSKGLKPEKEGKNKEGNTDKLKEGKYGTDVWFQIRKCIRKKNLYNNISSTGKSSIRGRTRANQW